MYLFIYLFRFFFFVNDTDITMLANLISKPENTLTCLINLDPWPVRYIEQKLTPTTKNTFMVAIINRVIVVNYEYQ